MTAAPEWVGRKSDRRIDIEGSAREVQEAIVDRTRTRTLLLLEGEHPPVNGFPRKGVRMDRLRRTDHRTVCPVKGEASHRPTACWWAAGRSAKPKIRVGNP